LAKEKQKLTLNEEVKETLVIQEVVQEKEESAEEELNNEVEVDVNQLSPMERVTKDYLNFFCG
jgi:hypothetical protein